MKTRILKFLKTTRQKIHLLIIGKDFAKRQKELETQIEFMSGIIAEQSRLIASIALVQSDLASTIKDTGVLESEGEYLTLRIPMSNDGLPN